ncbi:MAG: outer membrane beta-barrel protein [Pseudomonadota bacterium]
MLKKVLTTAVLGVSALGVMAANAAAPGVYVTGQLGYANTHMNNKTNISAISEAAKLDFKPDAADATNLSNNGLAGRLAIGYQFNQNFAVEMGYLQLNKKKVNGTIGADLTPASISLKENAIDLAGKAILPIANNLNVYGKLGVAYLTTTVNGKTTENGNPATYDLNGAANIAKHKWAPEAAIGVSYDITPNVSVDTSWTRIQPVGNNRPGSIDFVAVGLGYNFG